MREQIDAIIAKKGNRAFSFTGKSENPVKELKEVTKGVNNDAGMYFLFCSENELQNSENHLVFDIDGESYALIYFGKAGGITKNGKVIKQGLKDRINNVISDSSRDLKDVKRGKYWDIIIKEYKLSSFTIVYEYMDNPLDFERGLYKTLDDKQLEYPLLNKKLGRKV